MFEFNKEYYFNKKMFKDEYSVGEKVYYLDNNNKYKVGKIKEIEAGLYLISGCQYLRSKNQIYGACI